MRFFFVLAGLAIVTFCQWSCSPDEEQTEIENPVAEELITGLNAAPLLGGVVLENMYEDEARKLVDKTPVQIVTVLEGTSRVVLEARFRGVRDFGFGFPLYECELMDESVEAMGGIAGGMSGSPVGPPGRIMGALAYGSNFSKAPTRFWVTSIDAMEAMVNHQTLGDLLVEGTIPAAPGLRATYAPVKTPVMITGVQPHRIQELSSYFADSRYHFVELFADINGVAAAPPPGTSSDLAPGDMIGVALVTGDIVNATGFGTVTQVSGDTFLAFGHSLFGNGKSSLPVYRAVVNGIVPSYAASNKSVSIYGKPIGRLTKDLLPGTVGELGAPPSMIPVKVSYHPANSEAPIEKHHQVAYGQELFISTVAGTTLAALRMETSNSTIEATVTLQFHETDTVYTESFRQTTTDASSDVLTSVSQIVNSFTDTLANSAGKATLKGVSIVITDKPQIAQAEIAEVIVSEEILPGESTSVSIVLVPHWSVAGTDRTIRREVILEVPEDFPIGEAAINVSGNEFSGGLGGFLSDAVQDFEFGFEDFDGEEERKVPQTLDDLIKQMKEGQVDPGLITVTLSPAGFGDFSGFPLDLPPGEGEEDGEMPAGPPPELGDLEEFEQPEPVEVELTLNGFIVTGSKATTVMIKGEGMGEAPMEPAEPVEEE